MPGVKNRRLFEDRLDRSSCGLTRHKAKFPRRSGYRGGNRLEGPAIILVYYSVAEYLLDWKSVLY